MLHTFSHVVLVLCCFVEAIHYLKTLWFMECSSNACNIGTFGEPLESILIWLHLKNRWKANVKSFFWYIDHQWFCCAQKFTSVYYKEQIINYYNVFCLLKIRVKEWSNLFIAAPAPSMPPCWYLNSHWFLCISKHEEEKTRDLIWLMNLIRVFKSDLNPHEMCLESNYRRRCKPYVCCFLSCSDKTFFFFFFIKKSPIWFKLQEFANPPYFPDIKPCDYRGLSRMLKRISSSALVKVLKRVFTVFIPFQSAGRLAWLWLWGEVCEICTGK